MSHSNENPSSLQGLSSTSNQRQSEWTSNDISHDPHGSHHHSHHRQQHYDSEWEAKEELRLRELDEARARAAQMEKTMRWWSDCTANWREKWSKVRSERNKAREEARLIRTKLDSISKECNNIKRDKQELESVNEELRKELEQLKSLEITQLQCPDSANIYPQQSNIQIDRSLPEKDTNANAADSADTNDIAASRMPGLSEPPQLDISPTDKLISEELKSSNLTDYKAKNRRKGSTSSRSEVINITSLPSPEHERAEQKVAMLQLKLDEASKTIQAEREDKLQLNRTVEKLHEELALMKSKLDDMRQSKQETLKELNHAKAEHQDEIDSIRLDLEDESSNRSSLDERLSDLRSELEKMQAENAAEWGKRERLETEKLAIERENKKLKTHIEDLEERLERRSKQISNTSDTDAKSLQLELYEKNKQIADLRHTNSKLKKLVQEKSNELSHLNRRGEQYDSEVKKLRSRIEELKKELATAEDENDNHANNIRKLQRSNDELQERVDSYSLQVEHLQTRLRNSNHSLLSTRRGTNNLLQEHLSEDEELIK